MVAARQIEAWLDGEPPLRLVRVHELLAREGVTVGYTTLRRFASRELGWRKQAPTVRLDDPPPGQEAQIDFGLMGTVTDRRRKTAAAVGADRDAVVEPVHVRVADVHADDGGRVRGTGRRVAVLRRRAQARHPRQRVVDGGPRQQDGPDAQSRLPRLRGRAAIFADTARVRHPKDKARVENQVPYVRERWFAGEIFTADLVEIRRHAEAWCRDVAGARVHGTTRQVPREVYERDERPHMQPAPAAPFDVPHWSEPKVHPDHHVQVLKALYSVPTRYIGKSARRARRPLVGAALPRAPS